MLAARRQAFRRTPNRYCDAGSPRLWLGHRRRRLLVDVIEMKLERQPPTGR